MPSNNDDAARAARRAMEQLVEDLRTAEPGRSRTFTLEEILSELSADVEALDFPFVTNLLNAAIVGGEAGPLPGEDEEAMRVALIREELILMASTAKMLADLRERYVFSQDEALTEQFRDIGYVLLRDLAILGAVHMLNKKIKF